MHKNVEDTYTYNKHKIHTIRIHRLSLTAFRQPFLYTSFTAARVSFLLFSCLEKEGNMDVTTKNNNKNNNFLVTTKIKKECTLDYIVLVSPSGTCIIDMCVTFVVVLFPR